jgi:hypothetical protein
MGVKMAKNKVIIPALSALIMVIAVLHVAAMNYNLYFYLWWFDIVMHFLGGLWCGYFTLYYVSWYETKHAITWTRSRTWVAAVLATLLVGIGWEVYEYVFGFTFTLKSSYRLDTILDLVMDTSGAIVAAGSVMIYRSRGVR